MKYFSSNVSGEKIKIKKIYRTHKLPNNKSNMYIYFVSDEIINKDCLEEIDFKLSYHFDSNQKNLITLTEEKIIEIINKKSHIHRMLYDEKQIKKI